MANQKQRRRRAKEKRHDYDLVYVDEEGNEVPVETESKPHKPPAKVAGKAKGGAQRSRRGRQGRVPQPPSWSRVFKRAAIFGPIFFATVLLLGGKKMSIPSAIFQTFLLGVVFVPFSYFMDRVVYRQHLKRTGQSG